MNAPKQLDQARQRAQRYFYTDGLVELALGLLYVVIGALILAYQHSGPRGMHWLAGLGLLAFTMGCTFFFGWLVRSLKQRLTYPRSGQVSYHSQPDRSRRFITVTMLIIILAGVFLPEERPQIPLFAGGFVAFMLVYLGWQARVLRFLGLAAIALVATWWGVYYAAGELDGLAAVFLVTGAALLASGLLALLLYLARNPRPADSLTDG